MLENLTDYVSANKSYTKYNVPAGEEVDEIVLRVIKEDCPDFLLPISVMEVDGEKEIRYELSEGIKLSYDGVGYNSIKKIVTLKMVKRDFIMLLKNMLQPFQTCGDWFLDYHNILLDPEYILLSQKSYLVKYLYLPIAGNVQTDEKIVDFFETLITMADITDDPNYSGKLMKFLKINNGNLMDLFNCVLKDEVEAAEKGGEHANHGTRQWQEAGSVQAAEKQNTGLRPWWTEGKTKKEKDVQKEEEKENESKGQETDATSARGGARPGAYVGEFGKKDDLGQLQDILSEEDTGERKSLKPGKVKKQDKNQKANYAKEKKGLMSFFTKEKEKDEETAADDQVQSHEHVHSGKAEGFNNPQVNIETEISTNRTVKEGILRLELEKSEGKGTGCPKMVELDLTQKALTVGRLAADGQKQTDYSFGSAVTIISRRQFRVEWSNGQYMIMDLGSGNGTCVNGQKLGPNVKQCIKTGDRISIIAVDKGEVCYRVC